MKESSMYGFKFLEAGKSKSMVTASCEGLVLLPSVAKSLSDKGCMPQKPNSRDTALVHRLLFGS